jgi:hypothetical protein
LFGILNFGHCDLPFDLAQGGGELVEPFVICVLLFEIFITATQTLTPKILRFLQHVARKMA